jgi:hypothetical protein
MVINLYHKDDIIIAFSLSEDAATHKRVWLSKDHPNGVIVQDISVSVCEHDKEESYQQLRLFACY